MNKSFSHTRNKFFARKVTFQGMTFDSTYELDRYLYLLDLQKKGIISGLRRQVRFVLIPRTTRTEVKMLKTKTKNVQRVVEIEAKYHNDFCYEENGTYISEEFKSVQTSKLPDYILRRKLMIRKIYEHNAKCRGQWKFREVVYVNRNKTIITDK